MRAARITFVLVAALSALLFGAPPAAADAATEAQLQYDLAAELYRQGRYGEAIDRFIASHRLVPNANVVLNIVQTFEFLRRNEDAFDWNETYLRLATGNEERVRGLQRREQLGKKVAAVEVTTQPEGAEIFVDRIDLGSKGQSPVRFAVAPGERRIIARLARHEEASQSVAAVTGAVQPTVLKLTPLTGALIVSSAPAGASVKDERSGQLLGKTPLAIRLPIGEYRLVLSHPGFGRETRTVELVRERDARIWVELVRAAASAAILTVRGNVRGAEVLLNGRSLGTAPLSRQGLDPGSAEITISAPDRRAWKEWITLEPGAATRVDYDLVESKPEWGGWRWVGYGTGAALVAAGGIFGLSAMQARSDFEREPSRDAYDRANQHNLVADVLFVSGLLVIGGTLTWDLLRSAPEQSRAYVKTER